MLRAPRPEAITKLQLQIEKGERMLSPIPTTEDELYNFCEDLKIWADYNKELLLTLFTTSAMKNEFDYPIYTHTYMKFDEEVAEASDHLKKKLVILRSILKRIELIPEDLASVQKDPLGNTQPIVRSVESNKLKRPWYKKTAVQAALASGLFVLLSALLAPMVSHLLSSGEPKQKPVVTKAENSQHSTFQQTKQREVGEDARITLRKEHNVRALEPGESSMRLSNAPRGIYGFVDPIFISTGAIRLGRNPSKLNDFEVHKLMDGSAYVIGFVGTDTAIQIRIDRRNQKLKLVLYTDPWPNASEIVALPLSKIRVKQVPRRIELDDERGPKALDLELN
jgi:hypothetical protein